MPYPARVRAYVAAFCVLAAGAVALTLALAGWSWGEQWWIAPAFAVVLLLGSLRNLRATIQGREGITITQDESLLVALLFLAPAGPILVAFIAETVVAAALLRRVPLKAAFNTAKSALGISACLLVAGPQLPLEPNGTGALLAVAGIAAFIAVDHFGMAGVMAAVGAARARDYLREDLGGFALIWSANVAIGVLAGVAATVDPWLVPLAVGAMFPLHFALSGHVRAKVQRQRLEEVIAASSDGILATDRAGHVNVWNAEMERITGLSSAAALGAHVADALALADLGGAPLDPLTVSTGRRPALLDRDGTRRTLELSRGLLPDEGHVLVVHDATAERQLQHDLDEREQQLNEVQKLETIGQLTGGIAHDFNNLLVAIGGYGSLALGALEPEHPARADVEEVLRAADRAAALTRRLLDYSRRRPLEVRRLGLADAVDDLAPLLRRLVGGHVQIEVDHAGEPVSVEADPTQLEQVVLNLTVNARDAMPDGGTVTIRTRRDGDWAQLEVRDTGVGMDAETAARAFDPLFTTKAAGEGTGLGLSTVARIVKEAGGEIAIRSEPGQGSTFVVSLPAAPAAAAAAPVAAVHG